MVKYWIKQNKQGNKVKNLAKVEFIIISYFFNIIIPICSDCSHLNIINKKNNAEETSRKGLKLDIMVVKKEQEMDKLINSIQAKVDKIRKERKANKRKEPQSVDIICTPEDIAKSK
jgi:hypothetical protein